MKPQRLAPRMALGRHQPLVRNDASLDIVEDEGGIHEHRAVVAHEGRRLHDRIDRAKLVEGAKDGERLVLEGAAHGLHRDRGGAILAIALLGLVEDLFRTEIALDFTPMEAWAYDVSDRTGRMSGATGTALLLAGAAMLLLPRVRARWAQVGVKLLGLVVGAMALFALMGHVVSAPLLFPNYLFAGMAIHTPFGLLLLAFGLRELWRRFEWGL